MEITNLDGHFDAVVSGLGLDKIRAMLADKVSPEFLAAWDRRFNTQSNADGSPWSSDLVDTGELRSSVSVGVTDNTVSAGPSGARNEDIAAVWQDRGNDVCGIDEQLDEAIAEILDAFVGDAFMEQ